MKYVTYLLSPDGELYHYGIKGQKWGVRRYQRKDGTLTPAGKKRAREDYAAEAKAMSDEELRSKINRMNLENRYNKLTGKGESKLSKSLKSAEKGVNMAGDGTKLAGDASKLSGKTNTKNDAVNQGLNVARKSISATKKIDKMVTDSANAKIRQKNRVKLESMDDKELKNVVDRLDLEQQYSSLKKQNVSKGKVSVLQVLDVAGDILSVGASAVALAYGIKKLSDQMK